MITHKRARLTTTVHYPSKRDGWLVIVLLSTSIGFLYMPVVLLNEPIHPLLKASASIFFMLMAAMMLWILFSTGYELTNKHLTIRCTSLKYAIPLGDIYEVYPTHNPLSSPALPLDRLCIKFKGKRFGALISPKDKTRFLRELLARYPQLVRKEEKLVVMD